MKTAAMLLFVVESSWALNISFPMRFVSLVEPNFTRNYYRTTTNGPVPSTVVIELYNSELVFSDRELARADNAPIRSVYLRTHDQYAALEITRLGLRSARSNYLRHNDDYGHSWTYLTSHKAYLQPPHVMVDKYLENISAQGVWPVDLVVRTANLKEYSLTFHSLTDLKNFLGLGDSHVRTGPKPEFCEHTVSISLLRSAASAKPYLRLVE